jgi:hypothetical protein
VSAAAAITTGARAPLADEDELITVEQRSTVVIDACPDCLRTVWQHGQLSCEQLDALEACLAYAQLPLWRRLRTPAPAEWRVRTPAPEGRRS